LKGIKTWTLRQYGSALSEDRPDLKGIKTCVVVLVFMLLLSEDRPDLKGIKTFMNSPMRCLKNL
ncbi:MAG: hypothetical protein WBL07_04820, partial [Thiothrix litoralis]|uniref:hypothetical protein n=1 Tax=Thiothrix litoralis TaxID=2891210 RepID=UPI003C783EA7